MATIAVDTHEVVTYLQGAGFTKDQAEALVTAAKKVDLSSLATKADLKEALQDFQVQLYTFLAGTLIAHGLGTAALTVALIELLK
jgi:hypothetical protein